MPPIEPKLSMPGVYVQEIPSGGHTIVGVPTSVTVFIGRTGSGPVETPTTVTSFDAFATTFGRLDGELVLPYCVEDFFNNGGGTAIIVRAFVPPPPEQEAEEPLEGEQDGDQQDGEQQDGDQQDGGPLPLDDAAWRRALASLDGVDLYNVLCLPPDTLEGDPSSPALTAALVRCENMRAMLIVDPPCSWGTGEKSPDTIEPSDFSEAFGISAGAESARFAAVYWPRVKKVDPVMNGAVRVFPACGAIAGVWARTDASMGVWKAPAGMNAGLVGVADLAHKVSDEQNSHLNSIGVNCLRNFPTSGPVIWGARTMRGSDVLSDAYRFLSVRRLASFIETSLQRGTKWAVFMPNDEALWAALRQSVGSFMNQLYMQGAFQGSSAKEAWFVTCDASTTTQNDIDQGIVNVVIGFAPLKPAEFVVLYLQIAAASVP